MLEDEIGQKPNLDADIRENFNPKKKFPFTFPEKKKLIILAVVIGVVVVGLGTYAVVGLINPANDGSNDANTGQLSIGQDVTGDGDGEITVIKDECIYPVTPPESRSGLVKWQVPEEIFDFELFLDGDYRKSGASYDKVGEFISGKYKRSDVILVDAPCDGMCFYSDRYLFARGDKGNVLLGKYSDFITTSSDYPHYFVGEFTEDNDFYLSDLDFPEQFVGPDNSTIFTINRYANVPFCLNDLEKVFTLDQYGDVYTTKQTTTGKYGELSEFGFYLLSPEGTAVIYKMGIDFVSAGNVPQITWNDGTQNTGEYDYVDMGGCGAQNYLSVVFPGSINKDSELKVAGINSQGEQVYVFIDSNHEILKKIYEIEYNPWQGEKVSYDEFIKDRPAFFWQDQFGRLVKFQNRKFIPPAECGKPVIYLYPETKTEVSVKVQLEGGFSFTNPPYGNGWLVVAYPDGTLVESKTGEVYPYLFWEGRGGKYKQPEKGFVAAQSEVPALLDEKLKLLGLNEKEVFDFKAFWVPKMQEKPYYFVTFLTTKAVEQLAPMTVDPKADTVIRVLMDFEALDKPRVVEGFEIHTPQRDGFTVVEWGGVLR